VTVAVAGLCWHKASGKWYTRLILKGYTMYLGHFADEEVRPTTDDAALGAVVDDDANHMFYFRYRSYP
jgi:hypothetical protein